MRDGIESLFEVEEDCTYFRGRVWSDSISRIVSPGSGTFVGVSGSGSLLNQSALACVLPGLYSILYW